MPDFHHSSQSVQKLVWLGLQTELAEAGEHDPIHTNAVNAVKNNVYLKSLTTSLKNIFSFK